MKYKKYNIQLNDDGKIECRELGIVGETLDEVKKAIRATEVVQATKPKIAILYKAWRGNSRNQYCEGTTTGRATSNKYEYVWVSYKDENGKTKREKTSADNLALDTPENRALIAQIKKLQDSVEEQESQLSELLYQLKKL